MLKYYIREVRENVKSELKSTLESNECRVNAETDQISDAEEIVRGPPVHVFMQRNENGKVKII